MGAVEDILEWSTNRLTPWRRDALRRLASSSTIGIQDYDDLLELIKQSAGFSASKNLVEPIPLAKEHFSAALTGAPLEVRAIRNVKNVNRLVPSAGLTFGANGLTVIYGRNGSGKSGFVRILRTACRTRSDNPAKLKVLADVYGSGGGPQEAEIVINNGSGEVVVSWTGGGTAASQELLHIAVFDSSAAQLYVDGGNQIQFLPFGLALPHRLNELCLTLREKLEAERRPITNQTALATLAFETPRATKSQGFYSTLSAKTTDAQIDEETKFSEKDQARLDELQHLLAATTTSAADLTALASWLQSLATECSSLYEALSDSNFESYRTLKQQAIEARKATGLDAAALFTSEPLPGVGNETWRQLWLAARNYSVGDAYPGQDFPVLSSIDGTAVCVLCQQPFGASALDRMERFQAFMTGALVVAADAAEAKVAGTVAAFPNLSTLAAKDWANRIEQIRKRNPNLADAISLFREAAATRRSATIAIFETAETPLITGSDLVSPAANLIELSQLLLEEAETLTNADKEGQREKLVLEKAELSDRKIVAAGRDRIIKRRDLLKQDGLYVAALAEVQTKGITQKANELVDEHLTKIVLDQYESERKLLDIDYLKISLARKSDQTKAAFQTVPGTTLTKLPSDILSEGEQRALALAAFFTEVAITEGAGPIVIDDPVSSLDRDRGLKVAARIAAEAAKRQVIVFTHDLIFFYDLCREADERGLPIETISVFADASNAGKVDPAGVTWKGLNVGKRLGRIRNDLATVKKLQTTSPANYEIQVKNLYGRLRDTYERLVEEYIFCDVVRRGIDRVETQKLRMVHLSDALAVRFHEGMTKANTHSHDNPAAGTVAVPEPAEFEGDLAFIDSLVVDLKAESAAAEIKRPSMKPKKG